MNLKIGTRRKKATRVCLQQLVLYSCETHSLAMPVNCLCGVRTMKRLIILAACAALIFTSGCRNCRRRGAPCRSSLSFDPYTAAPAACGVDAVVADPACGQIVSL